MTSEINSQLRSMQAVNAAVSNELGGAHREGPTPNRGVIGGTKNAIALGADGESVPGTGRGFC